MKKGDMSNAEREGSQTEPHDRPALASPKRYRMSYAQYVRASCETVILGFAAMVGYATSWWVLGAVFVLLFVRNAMFPLKPDEY